MLSFLSRGQIDDKILNNEGENALQLAMEGSNEDVVKLLEAWGDQAALNKEMLTAAMKGRVRLLRAGADLQAKDEEGRLGLSLLNNLLIVAANEGLAGNIKIFFEAGVDVQTRNESGETGLDIAVKRGHRTAVEAFLDHGITGYNREESLQQCDKNRERINELNEKLRNAAMYGYNQRLEEALKDGAEITSTNSGGDNGLHLSAIDGRQSVMLTLLTWGLDPNIRGHGRGTALTMAAGEGRPPCVQTLLQHGALTNLQDNWGNTALIWPAKYNKLEIVAELLAKKADVNIVNDDKKTALQLAEERSNQDRCC